MSNDARLSTALPGHPKTKKLIRLVGEPGAWNLICLILWVRSSRPDGDLYGMSNEDIELAVDWRGPPDAFAHALVAVGFMDGEEGTYQMHDWAEHQPWSSGSEARSERARWVALCKHHGRSEAAHQMPEYAARISASSTKNDASSTVLPASSTVDACEQHDLRTKKAAPSPLPSPSPRSKALLATPVVPGKPSTPDCPHSEIVSAYHEILPELARVRDWTPDRQAFLRTRWREKPERQTVEWWRGYFRYVHGCPFLMGEGNSPGREPFYADLEWLVRPKNFRKVIEGKYQQRNRAAAA
jgi:hypothetical protein